METILSSLADLDSAASDLLARLSPRPEGATLVTLSGELGAGKTALTKALAASLGVIEPVTSPTFVLEKIYALPAGAGFARLAHIDAYRLTSGADLRALGFDALMEDAGTLVVLEWPEQVADGLPPPALRVTLAVLEDGTRRMTYA